MTNSLFESIVKTQLSFHEKVNINQKSLTQININFYIY